MGKNLLLLLLLLLICIFLFFGMYKILISIESTYDNKEPDLLDQRNFNMDTNNLNRWNFGNKDFAPYIDGSYKQVTNNYIPGMRHYSLDDFKFEGETSLNNPRVNYWNNKNTSKFFFVQCK